MKPQGHLITSVIATGATYAVTGSSELAIGVFCGAFWIDLDHYLDYVVFERQFSLNPFRVIPILSGQSSASLGARASFL